MFTILFLKIHILWITTLKDVALLSIKHLFIIPARVNFLTTFTRSTTT